MPYWLVSCMIICPAEWIMEYHQSRPGLKILQQRIDEFITAHEAEEEQVVFSLVYILSTPILVQVES